MPPKKPKLTPEERKKRAIAAKAEKKRTAEERKRQIKFDELSREIKYGNLNVKRYEKKWKTMLLDIALPEMRKDLIYAWYNFERVIDAKDYKISLILDEIQDAEEQYLMNIRSHSEEIDKFVNLFNDQMTELKIDNEMVIQYLKDFAEQEAVRLKKTQAEEESFLNMMLFGLEMKLKEQEQYIRCEYYSRMEDEIGKNDDIITKLKMDIHEECEKLWMRMQNFFKDYNKARNARNKEYKLLKNQDEQVTKLINNQMMKIHNLGKTIKSLKEKQIYLINTEGKRVRDLLDKRTLYADNFWKLKTQLEKEISIDAKHLMLFTVESNMLIEDLKKIQRKGEQILQFAGMCRKYETEAEKIMPFPMLSKIIPNEKYSVEKLNIADLTLFWKRIAQTDSCRYGLYSERKCLKMENDKIRRKIHEYCQCFKCPPEEIEVNENASINKIDGNEEIKKYNMAYK